MKSRTSPKRGATEARSAPVSNVEAEHHESCDDTRSVLKEYGLRYSRPREVILGYLLQKDRHVSAESLYVDLKQRGEDLSLSTVYLNLSTLADVGLVREFKGPSGQALYDSNVTPHYHVVCRETGEVRDIPAPEINGVSLARFLKEYAEATTGWQVDEPRFSLTGLAPRRAKVHAKNQAKNHAKNQVETRSERAAAATDHDNPHGAES